MYFLNLIVTSYEADLNPGLSMSHEAAALTTQLPWLDTHQSFLITLVHGWLSSLSKVYWTRGKAYTS